MCVSFCFKSLRKCTEGKREFSLYIDSGLYSPASNRTGTSICELEGQNRGHFMPQNIIPNDSYSSKTSDPLHISRVGGNALNEI